MLRKNDRPPSRTLSRWEQEGRAIAALLHHHDLANRAEFLACHADKINSTGENSTVRILPVPLKGVESGSRRTVDERRYFLAQDVIDADVDL